MARPTLIQQLYKENRQKIQTLGLTFKGEWYLICDHLAQTGKLRHHPNLNHMIVQQMNLSIRNPIFD